MVGKRKGDWPALESKVSNKGRLRNPSGKLGREMISQYQGNANLGQDFEEKSKEDEFCKVEGASKKFGWQLQVGV